MTTTTSDLSAPVGVVKHTKGAKGGKPIVRAQPKVSKGGKR